jgi:hypothetical protein
MSSNVTLTMARSHMPDASSLIACDATGTIRTRQPSESRISFNAC